MDLPLIETLNESQYTPDSLQQQYDSLLEQYKQQVIRFTTIMESVRLNKNDRGEIVINKGEDITAALERLSEQFDAAKRGLGIVNKLPKGEDRTKHARRVMGNLNTIRAVMQKIEKQLNNL